eukprot:m.68887 g.68887  ORF g.68887 m.68887 type:complete len:145 (-) comp50017_c0_seq4:8-442(-)
MDDDGWLGCETRRISDEGNQIAKYTELLKHYVPVGAFTKRAVRDDPLPQRAGRFLPVPIDEPLEEAPAGVNLLDAPAPEEPVDASPVEHRIEATFEEASPTTTARNEMGSPAVLTDAEPAREATTCLAPGAFAIDFSDLDLEDE